MSITAATKRLEHLATQVDGRNSHNGYCTWVDVRDGIEQVLAEIRGDSVSPFVALASEREDLAELEDMALVLAAEAHRIRVSAHDNQCDVKLEAAA